MPYSSLARTRPSAAAQWLAIGVALGLTGCIPPLAESEPLGGVNQPIVCEQSYANFAWVPTVAFVGITGDGQLLTFDSRATSGVPGFSLLGLELPERPTIRDIAHRYVLARPTGQAVPQAAVDQLVSLAEQAADGEITREMVAADSGQLSLDCFVADPGGRSFRIIQIMSDGDLTVRNSSVAAAQLVTELNALFADAAVQR